MTEIYVDADACPVKDEIVRVAERHKLVVHMVSNGGIRPGRSPFVKLVVVGEGLDVADDWIAEHIGAGDICITSDVPLADRCVKRGAQVLKPNGDAFTPDNMGTALATRNLMQGLREAGEITGGQKPFSKADRAAFLNAMEAAARRAISGKKLS